MLLADPSISTIDAPVDANVWKVLVEEKAELEKDQTVVMLEAMKLEINVNVSDELGGGKVEKLLVQPGETIQAGGHIALVRKG